jgi:minichromosome maintenance protein 10
MTHTSEPQRKKNYDPARQWGLKPSEAERGPTYVLSGHIVSEPGSGFDTGSMYVAESIGREGQAKAKRKLANKDADKALKALLERDKEGMKTVVRAREVAMRNDLEGNGVKGEKRGKGQKDAKKKRRDEDASDVPMKDVELNTLKNSYSAEVIKQLGFDPTAKASHRRANDMVVQRKVGGC